MNDKSSLIDLVVEKFVNEFRLASTFFFPYVNCKIRVWEREPGEYWAYPNLDIKNPETGVAIETSGQGQTPEAAFENCKDKLCTAIEGFSTEYGRPLTHDDFLYSNPNTF